MKFKFQHWRWLWAPLVIILGLLLLALLARQGGVLVEKWLLIKSRPAISVTTGTPVSAELLFNHEPGVEIFSERIVAEIGQAQQSLEIAMYAFSSVKLKEAVYAAQRRGVKVTIITDFRKRENHEAFFADAVKDIKRLEAGAETASKTILMHHKFALIDRGTANQKLLFGAYNWTDLQEKYDPSFLMVSTSSELVASFGREFDRLLVGQAGTQKLRDQAYHPWDLELNAAGYTSEVWFSPGREGDGIKTRLSSLINSAQQEIQIMIWDFTDKELAVDLIRRARQGVKVTIITDTWNFYNQNSVFLYLAEAKQRYQLDNFELIVDKVGGDKTIAAVNAPDLEADFDPFLHFHVLIVDGHKVLFGTNNWSRAGSYFNDESMMISEDPAIAAAFQDAFRYQYQHNTIPLAETKVIVD